MPNPRILVTGASGFVGGHFLRLLVNQYNNIPFAVIGRPNDNVAELLPPQNIHHAELRDLSQVEKVMQAVQPDWILHLASLSAVGNSFAAAASVLQDNLSLQFAVLEAMRRHAPTARLIIAGSAAQYGVLPPKYDATRITEDFPFYPNNPYAVSKAAQEHLTQSYHLAYGLDLVMVRSFNLIGPGQTAEFVVPAMAKQIVAVERGQSSSVKVGNLSAVRDFTDVRDAVAAYYLLFTEGQAGQVYNLGSGQGYSMQHVLDELIQMSDRDIVVETDPARLRPSDVPVSVADVRKLQGLGWNTQVSLNTTLQDVLEFERNA